MSTRHRILRFLVPSDRLRSLLEALRSGYTALGRSLAACLPLAALFFSLFSPTFVRYPREGAYSPKVCTIYPLLSFMSAIYVLLPACCSIKIKEFAVRVLWRF